MTNSTIPGAGLPLPGTFMPSPFDGDIAGKIGFRMRFAQAAIWKDLLETFQPFALRPQHYAALSMIAAREGMTQQDLSAALTIQGPNLVTLLDGLAGPGYVERRQLPSDRRFNGLFLSRAGQSLLAQMNEAQRQHEGRISAQLSGEEQHELVRLLRKLEMISRAE